MPRRARCVAAYLGMSSFRHLSWLLAISERWEIASTAKLWFYAARVDLSCLLFRFFSVTKTSSLATLENSQTPIGACALGLITQSCSEIPRHLWLQHELQARLSVHANDSAVGSKWLTWRFDANNGQANVENWIINNDLMKQTPN